MKIAREQRVDLAIPARRAETELPEGWAMVRLADVVEEVPNVKPDDEPHREFGYVDISSICNETHQILDHKRFKGKDAPSRARRPIRPGDVLFSNVRTYLRNVAIVPSSLDVQLCSTGFTVLRSNGVIDPQFLFRYVLTDDFIDRVTPQQTGTHYPATSDRVVMGESLPFPPLAEQQRIVAKVEALLTRVNAARERLARVPAILKRFRQSVLTAACSGRLTADWRDQNDEVEPADTLLQRGLAERFGIWCRAELAKMKAAGRSTRNDSWSKRYEIPIEIDTTDLPDIPATWRWTPFDSLAASFQYGPRFGEDEYTDDGIPTVRTTDMDFCGRIRLNNPPKVRIPSEAREHFLLQHDDLLVTRTGATIGKCVLFDSQLGDAIASAYLIRYRLTRVTSSPRYLLTVLMSPWGQHRLIGGVTAVAQPNINTTMIARIPIPLPPLPEQHEIVRRVEALLRLADAIEKRVASGTARVENLTQAILGKAFRGKLVPTEAELARQEGRDYEPASALLERIRAERAATSAPPKRRARPRKT